MKRHLYLAIVFLTGAAVLVIEIAATRVLAPFYGNTIFTFSSVISVILAALSFGYYIGGRLADRHPSPQWFFTLIALSGISIYLCQLLASWLLPALSPRLPVTTGPLLLAILLFFLPGILLGTLSPWAIKLQQTLNPTDGIATTAGKVFFWSTFGSITGSLLTGFVFIPHFGLTAIMLTTATFLFVLGLIGLLLARRPIARAPVVILIAAAILFGALAVASAPRPPAGTVYQRNGIYEQITVRDILHEGRPARVLLQDRTVSGLMFLDNGEPVDYALYPPIAHLVKSDFRRVLTIGGGTYVLPRLLLGHFPNATVDVAEIEPSLYEVGQRYFNVLPDARLRNHVADGRRFLIDAQPYDFIFADVYYGMTVPPHFTTRGYHQLVRDRLTPGGVYMANLMGDLSATGRNILHSQMRVLREVFPNSEFFATDTPETAGSQSIVAIAINGDTPLDFASAQITDHPNPLIRSLPARRIDTTQIDWENHPILTDDYSPAEYFSLGIIRNDLSE